MWSFAFSTYCSPRKGFKVTGGNIENIGAKSPSLAEETFVVGASKLRKQAQAVRKYSETTR